MKNMPFVLALALLLSAVIFPNGACAAEESGQSARPATSNFNVFDLRVIKLRNYLKYHNSPLADYARVFVEKADKYSLDYRLVASISGVESTFGKNIPRNSYNAYGWNGGNYSFKNWEDGIETVSKTLRENYMDKWGADTVYKIAPIYAPPSKTWGSNVAYFMDQIEQGITDRRRALVLKPTI